MVTPADTVRNIALMLHGYAGRRSYLTTELEQDDNTPPADTDGYIGRALAFHVYADGRELRVTVEDVTLNEDGE